MLRLRFVAPVHVCHRLQEHLTTAVHPVERALPVCPSCTDVTGISSALACIVSFILFLRREFQVEVLSPGVCILVLKTTAFRFPASWYFELLIYFEAIMCFPEHICDCWCLEVSVIYMWCTASSQLHLCQLRCLVGVSVYMWRKKKKAMNHLFHMSKNFCRPAHDLWCIVMFIATCAVVSVSGFFLFC